MKKLICKGKVVKGIEERFDTHIESLLHELYIVDMMSAEEIAGFLGTSHVTINKCLVKIGIKRRFDWKELVKKCEERMESNE